MQEKKNKKTGLFSIFSDSIQLRFYRKENFEQVGSFDLSPRWIYITLSSIVLLLMILSFVLLAFTPLQRLIPRLSSIENTNKFIQISENLDDIEATIESQEVYLSVVRQLLQGEKAENILELTGFNPMQEQTVITPPPSETNVNSNIIAYNVPDETSVQKGTIFDEMEAVEFISPIEGIISADFDPQIKHYGVDIIAPASTPVKAVRDGHIIIADWSIETGHTLGVQHDNNILSFYKHNSVLLKEKGNFVKAGETIAIIGNSGRLTNGPHLHFEMWHNGKPVNPNEYINLK